MKRFFCTLFVMLLIPVNLRAAGLNMDPYFSVGTAFMRANLAGKTSNAPSGYVVMGTKLPWVYSNFEVEFRFGVGGQLSAYSGDIKLFSSYLLKPGLALTHNLDLYGLLGVGTMNVTVLGAKSSDTNLNYGLGLKYHIPNESLTIEGEWMQYHKSTNGSATSISGMNISGTSIMISFEYY